MKALPIILFIAVISLAALEAPAGAGEILWIEISGYISPGMAEHVAENIITAEKYSAILITIDTFGGQADAMIRIIETIQNSPVPVIGFVYPPSGKALSAGTFILMATDYAAMAPGTLIGSAHPVVGGVPSNDTKIINFFVAKMRSLAEIHGRNVSEAEKLITQNKNFGPEEALEAGLIEAVASNPAELLYKADGVEVNTMRGVVRLQTAGREVVKSGMSLRSLAVVALSDPVVSSLLLTVGVIALVGGLLSPGWGAELAGGLMIILGLVGQGFNINLAGGLLAAIGAGLLIFELYTPSFGVIGAGGVIALSIGMILLLGYPPSTTLISTEWFSQFQSAIIVVAVSSVALMAFLGYKALGPRRKQPVSLEPSGLGRAVDDIVAGGEGYVVVSGEYWLAKALANVRAGTRVRVVGRENNRLVVEPSE